MKPSRAIKTALENCYASNPNLEVNEVYVGIAGHHIKSLQTRGDIVRQERKMKFLNVRLINLVAINTKRTFLQATRLLT
jgi:cell division protein FtsA